ncbi:CBS domain-containing protein [Amycolatopsis japonica]|uniref:CBS domain-containing protein n=1 Tax=Amycolatopsis japonica TaxID=208439 RepID=UPI00333499A4
MRVREVMTTPVVAVTPAATLGEAIAVLAGKGFTSLPVVDETGRLLGVLEEDDVVLACYVPGPRSPSGPDAGVLLGGRTKVRDVMRTPGAGTHPDTELADLAERMLEHRLRSVPVLDHGRVVGVVTWRDLLRARATETSSRDMP